jgi:hypothetical protein
VPSSSSKVIFGALSLVAIVAWVLLLRDIGWDNPSVNAEEWFGYLTAILALLLFGGVIHRFGATFRGLYVGADNRVSTSKVQVLVWTFAIAGVLMASIGQSWAGLPKALEAISSSSFEYGPYLVLLGGPFLAAVAARGIVGSQLAQGTTTKTTSSTAEAKQVFTDDEGNTDLVDTQYLLFNLVAIAFFIGAFIGNPQGGFPAIPTFLYVLTGASALGYVTNKAIPSGAPEIKSVSPSSAAAGDQVTVIGSGLLFPDSPTGIGQNPTAFQNVEILIGGLKAVIGTNPTDITSNMGADRIVALVPAGLTAGEANVVAINFQGKQSAPVVLTVL